MRTIEDDLCGSVNQSSSEDLKEYERHALEAVSRGEVHHSNIFLSNDAFLAESMSSTLAATTTVTIAAVPATLTWETATTTVTGLLVATAL